MSVAITDRLNRYLPIGSLEDDVKAKVKEQGFRQIGDKPLVYLFERTGIPCKERFLAILTIDDLHHLRRVQGSYSLQCP